jgi:hypothetical protein
MKRADKGAELVLARKRPKDGVLVDHPFEFAANVVAACHLADVGD